MQWVITTGDTVAEATDRALDALGIDSTDAECEVLDEALVDRRGTIVLPARVRMRVKPTRPRPKVDRRQRKKRPGRGKGRGGRQSAERNDTAADAPSSNRKRRRRRGGNTETPAEATTEAAATTPDAPAPAAEQSTASAPEAPKTDPTPTRGRPKEEEDAMSDISVAEQEAPAVAFLEGLLDAFDVDADIEATTDDEAVEIAVTGDGALGLLVGQRGTTLSAIQELTRRAVAQSCGGRLDGRLRVDVAGYRAKRTEALARFATKVAEQVLETGKAVAMDPMSPPDRKVIHDTVNEIDGVRTVSRGEDHRRHIVVQPD